MAQFFWPTHRSVLYDHPAQAVLDQYTDPNDRFHHQIMGIEWLLCRTPQIGLPRSKNDITRFVLYVAKGNALAKTFDVWLLYSYDDESVCVHGVHVDGRDENAG